MTNLFSKTLLRFKSTSTKIVFLLITFLPVIFLYQNCGQPSFKAANNSESYKGANGAGTSYCLTNPTDSACLTTPTSQCSFNGQVVKENGVVTGFLNSSVPYGQGCQQETRTCIKGALSGSYNFGTCAVAAAKSCLFNGQTTASDKSVVAYVNSAVPFGSQCVSQTRICNDGTLSGEGEFSTCSVGQPSSCLFDGKTIAHGASVSAYTASTVPYTSKCTAQLRTCYNGALSGAGDFASCIAGQPASCTFNGRTIASGEQVTAYATSTVPYGQTCSAVTRICENGTLSGAGAYGSCTVNQAVACLINGQTIPSGGQITLYTSQSVPWGGSCATETRVCTNGTLSGSAQFGSCSVPPCDTGYSFRPKDGRCLKGLIIMPLGDSLTYGLNAGDVPGASGGYRAPLFKKLQEKYGQDVYFVGSERNGPLPENRHQGHPGYNTAQIADVIDKGYLEDAQPNIILLMIGTNDIALGLSRDEAPNRVQTIIQKVFTHLPDVHLIVASIPPQPMDPGGLAKIYSERVRQIVSSFAAQGVRVSFADVNSALSFADVYDPVADSLHMNSVGYSKIADVFFGAISALNVGLLKP